MIFTIIVAFISFHVSLMLGSYLLLKRPAYPVHILFAVLCFLEASLFFLEFQMNISESPERMNFWYTCGSYWPLMTIFIVHFMTTYTKSAILRHKLLYYPFLILPPVILTVLTYFHPLALGIPVNTGKFWIVIAPQGDLLYDISSIWAVLTIVVTWVLCFRYYRRLSPGRRRKQAVYILVGFLLPLISIVIFDVVLPYARAEIPSFSTIFGMASSIIVGYGLMRGEYYLINPERSSQHILKVMSDALILMDRNEKIIETNDAACRLIGLDRRKIIGRSFTETFCRSPKTSRIDFFSTDRIAANECVLVNDSGVSIPVSFSSAVIRDPFSSETMGVVCIIRDLTYQHKMTEERYRLLEDLGRAQKLEALGRLAGSIAHDFNNILGSIIIMAQEILDQYGPGNPDLQDSVDNILDASRHAVRYIGQLLAFGGQRSPEFTPVSLNDIISGVLGTISRTFSRSIKIKAKLDINDPIIQGNREQLEDMLYNIVNNSRDAMPDGGDLTINTILVTGPCLPLDVENGTGCIRLVVKDTGCGMEERVLERVFEPFFTTKTAFPQSGTGLGLAGVYRTVKSHGGEIMVESKVDRGTTVTIRFPLADAKIPNVEPEKEAEPGKAMHGRVIVVEDDLRFRISLEKTLRRRHLEVWSCGDSEDALRLFTDTRFELVILDLNLPGLSGTDCFHRMRKIREHQKVLFISGDPPDQYLRVILDTYPDEVRFLRKPFQREAMLETIAYFLP